MHADTDTGVQHDQQERWGQCGVRYPPTATQNRVELKPWHQAQGGVVETDGLFGVSGLGRSLKVKRVCVVSCFQKRLFIGT